MNIKLIYSAIVLNNISSNILKSYIVIGESSFKVYCDHITLKYGISSYPEMLGKNVKIKLESICLSQYCQVAKVSFIDDEIKSICCNRIPHITLSTDKNTKPSFSNVLLNEGKFISETNVSNIYLFGKIAVFTNNGWIYSKNEL